MTLNGKHRKCISLHSVLIIIRSADLSEFKVQSSSAKKMGVSRMLIQHTVSQLVGFLRDMDDSHQSGRGESVSFPDLDDNYDFLFKVGFG